MQHIPLPKSIWKPKLLMGCEVLPFTLVAISSGIMVLQGGLWVKVFGVVYFVFLIAGMAYCNSRDPFFFRILFRYLKYQDFYANTALYPSKADKPEAE